jgi:hypothetical protein
VQRTIIASSVKDISAGYTKNSGDRKKIWLAYINTSKRVLGKPNVVTALSGNLKHIFLYKVTQQQSLNDQ